MQSPRIKTLLPLAAFIWLLSPSFYLFWQGASPVDSSLLPPLSVGQRVMLAPLPILDQLCYWLWPMEREPLTFTILPEATMRQGLFFWLILVLTIRFSWRLRKAEPWIFYGILASIAGFIPFSGIIPRLVQPFSPLPQLFGGIGLSFLVAALLLRGFQGWDKSTKMPKFSRYGWRFIGVLTVIWVGIMSVNLIAVMGRSWDERLDIVASKPGERVDFVVAVERTRQLASTNPAEAESLIIEYGQGAPWYPEIPVIKAEMLIAQNEHAAAVVHLENALKLDPKHSHAKELQEELKAGE